MQYYKHEQIYWCFLSKMHTNSIIGYDQHSCFVCVVRKLLYVSSNATNKNVLKNFVTTK